MNKRVKGAILGIVQGVGFRPFIFQLASRHFLSGYVTNTPQGVDIEVEGEEESVTNFIKNINSELPPLALVASSDWREISLKNDTSFEIKKSLLGKEKLALISPDVSICQDCLNELIDVKNRRFRYPFINCTNCGPRYTIMLDIPYDRAATTMKKFKMCPSCEKEYLDPTNRRFHAQPNACWNCGPKVFFHDTDGKQIDCSDPITKAISHLKRGTILAIKGLGGFHLAVDASNHKAVVRLRRRKHREEKPLAIMVNDLDTASGVAKINEIEAQTLLSLHRPIVLLRKRRFHGLSSQVAPKNRYIGIMLPYTPLHYLLMEGPFKALVMTSGNMTEEPITIENQKAFGNLKGIADYFLVHNRDIHLRSDDSVVRVAGEVPRQIRRSRGFVPVPIFLSKEMPLFPSVLALGAELKNTVCFTKEARAFISQHVGDMENMETLNFFRLTIEHLKKILEIKPKVLAHDLHPDYLSSKYAQEQDELPAIAIQHHHAHIVSCMAEHGLKGPVIGIALDGTGLGSDGRIWGGEILMADPVSFKRVAHLKNIPLPGGDSAIKSPWRMALLNLYEIYGHDLFNLSIPFVRRIDREKASIIIKMAEKKINSPLTSSCGRLFDAVSSLIGLRDKIAYEGQAAVELEMCQSQGEKGKYPWTINASDNLLVMDTGGIIKGIVDDIIIRTTRGIISSRFHNTLIHMLIETCVMIRDTFGINEIALSGGAFQNVTLMMGMTRELSKRDFTVFNHVNVPANDGGVSLGQALSAGLRQIGWQGSFEKENESL